MNDCSEMVDMEGWEARRKSRPSRRRAGLGWSCVDVDVGVDVDGRGVGIRGDDEAAGDMVLERVWKAVSTALRSSSTVEFLRLIVEGDETCTAPEEKDE